jgi:hypothetical protein
MAFSPVDQILNNIKKQLGLDADFVTLMKVWDKEVPIAQICGYKNGAIFAQTQSSAALAEINLRKREIIKRLNQYLGERKIKDIKVSIGNEV